MKHAQARPFSVWTAEERERVLLEHLTQVQYIARRIHDRLPPQTQLGDLIDAGVVGLLEALQKFDPARNVDLKSYAKFRIRGAILDSLRELDWSPRPLRRKARLLEDAHVRLRQRLGRPATESELAAELGMALKSLQRLLGNLRGLDLASLQDELARGRREGETSLDRSPAIADDPYSQSVRSEMEGLVALALTELPPRERQVLALYYYEELTMKEVGAILGVAEARISQIHSSALVRLRAWIRSSLSVPPVPGPERFRRPPSHHPTTVPPVRPHRGLVPAAFSGH